MLVFTHIFLFLLAASIVWYFAGLLIESVNRVAKRFHQNSFTIAFFVLGFITSISEISVMVNSTIDKTPQVSAGNLAGASFVIILFIIPLLAVLGNGIGLRNTLSRRNLALGLFSMLLPTLFLIDGDVTRSEGLVCLLSYFTLFYFIRKKETLPAAVAVEEVEEGLLKKAQATTWDVAKIFGGGVFIFLGGHILVQESVFFAELLTVPRSIIGLVVLSLGTNIPELVVAVCAIRKKKKDIAFGNYIGSALANTFIFGLLPFFNGTFLSEPSGFMITLVLTVVGFALFYASCLSKNRLSRKEGLLILSIYALFLVFHVINAVRIAGA